METEIETVAATEGKEKKINRVLVPVQHAKAFVYFTRR